jgi:SAM-dependent methyltransferase
MVNEFWAGVSRTRLTELSFSRTAGPKLLEFVGSYLPPGARCLDFGAGDGSLIRLLVQRGCPAAAYEPSPERRDQILDSSLESDPNFLGFVGPEDEKSFDVLIAAEVIEHVLDHEIEGVMRTFHKYLKPGGTLIVSTPNNEDLDLGSCFCPVSGVFFHRWQHVRSFSAESLSGLLQRGGFTRVADHRVDFSAYGELYEKYLQLTSDVRHLRRLGPLYPLVRRFLQKPAVEELRLGAQTHLIYIGRPG